MSVLLVEATVTAAAEAEETVVSVVNKPEFSHSEVVVVVVDRSAPSPRLETGAALRLDKAGGV